MTTLIQTFKNLCAITGKKNYVYKENHFRTTCKTTVFTIIRRVFEEEASQLKFNTSRFTFSK